MDSKKAELNLRATGAVEGSLAAMALSWDGSRLYALSADGSRLDLVGPGAMRVLHRVDLYGHGATDRLFPSHRQDTLYLPGVPDKLMLFDGASGQFVGSLPCGGRPRGLAFVPASSRAFLTWEGPTGGTVELVDERGFGPLARLDFTRAPIAESMALAPRSDLAAVLLRPRGEGPVEAACWRMQGLVPVCTVPVGGGACALAFDGSGERLFVACPDDLEVAVIDIVEERVLRRIRMPGRPYQLRADREGRAIWVLCEKLGCVAVLEAGHGSIVASVPLGAVAGPSNRMIFSPEGKLLAVPMGSDGAVALVNADPTHSRYGGLEDRLELGTPLAAAVWSPLGDEIYAADTGGALFALRVSRGDIGIDDTDQYLPENTRWRAGRGPRPPD